MAVANRYPAIRRSFRPDHKVRGLGEMSTIFNVRNMKMPALSKTSVIVGSVIVIVGLIAAYAGYYVFNKLTTNTVVAEFPQTLALYPGDKVQIMGVRVGSIDSIEPAGDKMRVTFHYDSKYKVPANATASVRTRAWSRRAPSSWRRPTRAVR